MANIKKFKAMIQLKCIEKIRDKHNNITDYRLQDINGHTKRISAKELKLLILNKKVEITNLRLTSNNTLVDKHSSKTVSQVSTCVLTEEQFKSELNKIFNKFIQLVGRGEAWQNTDSNPENGNYLTTQITSIYKDNNLEEYGITFGIDYNDNEKQAFAMFQSDNGWGKEEFSEQVSLAKPLFSTYNINNIKLLMNKIYKDFIKWKSNIENRN